MDEGSIFRQFAPERSGNRHKSNSIIIFTIAIAGVVALAVGVSILINRSHSKDNGHILVSQLASQKVSMPVYYPQNLPAGYAYNDDVKVPKPDIFYYSVTGPNKQVFFVAQQQIPANFDFTKFNKKFLNPDTFSTDVGSAIAGQLAANTVGSIRTNRNTWIIIKSNGTNSLTQLEIVARSLELTQ